MNNNGPLGLQAISYAVAFICSPLKNYLAVRSHELCLPESVGN